MKRTPRLQDGGAAKHDRLHHESLDVYVAAVDFLAIAAELIDQFPGIDGRSEESPWGQ